MTVNGDAAIEPDETFFVNVTNVTGASVADGQGIGTITNDDVAGVTVTESGGVTNVAEGGATDTFSIALNSQPAANVTVSFNTGSQLQAINSITFTPANWNVAQTITVAAVDDNVVEGAHTGTISHSASSSDANYNGISIANVTANITDNDISVTVTTSPAGLSITVDSVSYTSPQTFTWTAGSNHTIATISPQSAGAGTQYAFDNWSDAGAISHTVSPASATTYTASFKTQYYLTTSAGAGGTISPASGFYDAGNVNISATANSGYTFTGFSGALTGTTNPQTLNLTGPASVTASFASLCSALPPTITLKPFATPFPNDHKYRTFAIADMVASATDGCGGNLLPNVVIEQVTSDEPDNVKGNGDGETINDIVIAANCKSVQLRAERDGNKNGRVYVVKLRVSDASGNKAWANFKVRVPLSQNGNPAVEDPAVLLRTSNCPCNCP